MRVWQKFWKKFIVQSASAQHSAAVNYRPRWCAVVLIEADRVGALKLDQVTINPSANESFAFKLLEHIAEFAGLLLDQRRQQNDFESRFVRKNPIENLLRRLTGQCFASKRIMRLIDSGTCR